MRSEDWAGIGKRIKRARETLQPAPMKQTDLAARLGVSQARLSNWERGEHEPQLEYVIEAAKVLNVGLEWLLGEETPMRDPGKNVPVVRTGFRFIPVKGAITAGMPATTDADVDWIEVKDWGGDLQRWGRVIDGFSMTSDKHDPDDLQPGDVAIFEDRRAELGHIVHAFSDGADTVKVLRRIQNRIQLWPINPDYEPIEGEGWRTKGVVVMRIRNREHGIVETVEYPHGMRHKFY
jgi:repressor LexA